MASLSFDQVAHIYDATRGYPEGVAGEIAEALAEAARASAGTRFLEIGVGTGRIAYPLIATDHLYTGLDISEKMVAQLEEKLVTQGWQTSDLPWGTFPDEDQAYDPLTRRFARHAEQKQNQPAVRLVIADMTEMPFRDASFDVVVAVHIFHLVDGWQQAIAETLRVLRPGGCFLHGWDANKSAQNWPVQETWRQIVRELGHEMRRPGPEARTEVTSWLRAQGLASEELHLVHWQASITPRQAVESFSQRILSSTWGLPETVFAEAATRLEAWAQNYFHGDLDTPTLLEREFVVSRTRLP